MPDDALYARKIAQSHGIELHEIEIKPDVVELLPRMVDILDEPTGDPAAINTLLMSDAARGGGSQGPFVRYGRGRALRRIPQTMACLLAGRCRRLPGSVHRSATGIVDRLPVTAAGRGLRYARWAKRLTFAELPEEAVPSELQLVRSRGARSAAQPGLARRHRRCRCPTPRSLRRQCPIGSGQPPVPRRHQDVPPRPQPGLHGSGQHGRLTEVRVPFVDVEVFRAAFSLVGKEKISGRSGKVALKQAAEAWLPHGSSTVQSILWRHSARGSLETCAR